MKKIFAGFIGAALLSSSLGCSNSNVRASTSPPPAKVEVAPVILQVLTNETNCFSAKLNRVQAQLNERLALVQLYQALSGGWQQ